MTKKRRKIMGWTLIMIVLAVIYYFLQLNWISVTTHVIHLDDLPKEFDGYKIVQLSDLHNQEFGYENERLIERINQIKPDIIVMTGDMLTNTREVSTNGDVLIKLVESLNQQYPIYYVTGEHEEGLYYEDRNKYQIDGTKEDYEEKLSQLGVTVLNDEQVTITRQDATINVYGLKEHLSGDIQIDKRLGQSNEEEVTILLSHRPTYFDDYTKWGADLIFCGDTHGGMIRLPVIGGILSAEGFFPEYDGGLFRKENSVMVVSRGLGNNPIPLRINNRPEIVEVILKSK